MMYNPVTSKVGLYASVAVSIAPIITALIQYASSASKEALAAVQTQEYVLEARVATLSRELGVHNSLIDAKERLSKYEASLATTNRRLHALESLPLAGNGAEAHPIPNADQSSSSEDGDSPRTSSKWRHPRGMEWPANDQGPPAAAAQRPQHIDAGVGTDPLPYV